MRAIVYDPGAPHGLRLGTAPDPVPGAHEALVEVHAIALNFGEIAFLAERRTPGQVIGWECAGVVLERLRQDTKQYASQLALEAREFWGSWLTEAVVDLPQAQSERDRASLV